MACSNCSGTSARRLTVPPPTAPSEEPSPSAASLWPRRQFCAIAGTFPADRHQFPTPRGDRQIPRLGGPIRRPKLRYQAGSAVLPGSGGACGWAAPQASPVKGGKRPSRPSPRTPGSLGSGWGKTGKTWPPVRNWPGKTGLISIVDQSLLGARVSGSNATRLERCVFGCRRHAGLEGSG